MHTIAVINMKGGCAKTTTAANMAYILADSYGKKVLAVDSDKQGNLSKACGVWGYETPGMAELLLGSVHITEAIQETNHPSLDAVSANMRLLAANLAVIKDEGSKQTGILKGHLDQVGDAYDYCIIDCPPDIDISVINVLAAADEVIIPIKIDGYAFDGMGELTEQIENARAFNPGLKLRGCLVTMYYNRDVCRQGEEWLKDNGYPVFGTHIRRTEKADEATFTNLSLAQYSPRSAAAKDYRAFVAEYLEGDADGRPT